ncbi:hypothetical protein SCP_0209250 [Sparassis crispa]|uniref:Uncharacterized protein n=1 Tax=Sparassis crispa TaxID=139825 RepID=A0A401GC25_9APHY|nr:hypothetical protein SCP_0209250 [Sparassis crispa]GBE79724.1 hypothetical protein SCP_0209250 [Sparassis crispa]
MIQTQRSLKSPSPPRPSPAEGRVPVSPPVSPKTRRPSIGPRFRFPLASSKPTKPMHISDSKPTKAIHISDPVLKDVCDFQRNRPLGSGATIVQSPQEAWAHVLVQF